ncbi:MAG: hypothetical protein QXK73_02845 [Candidatus Bathyarchaeia archaeon]
MLNIGKALGGDFPVAAVVGLKKVMDNLPKASPARDVCRKCFRMRCGIEKYFSLITLKQIIMSVTF